LFTLGVSCFYNRFYFRQHFTFFAVGKFYPGKTFLCAGEDELPARKTTKKKGKKMKEIDKILEMADNCVEPNEVAEYINSRDLWLKVSERIPAIFEYINTEKWLDKIPHKALLNALVGGTDLTPKCEEKALSRAMSGEFVELVLTRNEYLPKLLDSYGAVKDMTACMWDEILSLPNTLDHIDAIKFRLGEAPRRVQILLAIVSPASLNLLNEAGFHPSKAEWIEMAESTDLLIPVFERQPEFHLLGADDWIDAIIYLKSFFELAKKHKIFDKFFLSDWKKLLLKSSIADDIAHEFGVFDKLASGDLMEVLLRNPDRGKYCGFKNLSLDDWTSLMASNSDFVTVAKKHNIIAQLNNQQVNDIAAMNPEVVYSGEFPIDWNNIDEETRASLRQYIVVIGKENLLEQKSLEEIYSE